MSIGVLKSVVRHTEKTGGAMTTTPLRSVIREEVDAGNLIASQARCGPLGLFTGEVFLTITDAGRKKLEEASNAEVTGRSLADGPVDRRVVRQTGTNDERTEK